MTLDQNGRVVIPASIRHGMGLTQGQRLLRRLEGDRIILEKTSGILSKLQQRFSKISGSLADELVAITAAMMARARIQVGHVRLPLIQHESLASRFPGLFIMMCKLLQLVNRGLRVIHPFTQ